MRKRWILIAMAVGLLAALVTGGVALAWGGNSHGWGWGRGNNEERQSAVAAKVAEILGTDAEETADAIEQANREVRDEAAQAALNDFAGRIAQTLGTDATATANAMQQVVQEMSSEALESKLQSALDSGRITEEQARAIRDRAASGQWRGKPITLKNQADTQEFANRLGAIIGADGQAVTDAIQQAKADIRAEALEARLQAAIDSGRITEEKAAEIREKIESGDWPRFGNGGRHGGKGHWGRGHHRGRGHGDTTTSEPVTEGDST